MSALNGFQHDLQVVAELAHAEGALVYADVIQCVGAVPMDVTAAGIDFCAGSSYKWLMGEMGLGFLYVRKAILDRIEPVQFGYRQLNWTSKEIQISGEWIRQPGAPGKFEVGTINSFGVAVASWCLPYILGLTVEAIYSHRRMLLEHLRADVSALGFQILTPPSSHGPILAISCADQGRISESFAQSGIQVTVYPDRIRVAPSVFNSHDDIEGLLSVLRRHA